MLGEGDLHKRLTLVKKKSLPLSPPNPNEDVTTPYSVKIRWSISHDPKLTTNIQKIYYAQLGKTLSLSRPTN